ncbi:general secretion pathway protein GspL [Geomonas nitrogeniifigens]|uniref:General secretion pathway protein GspL n=1 Tax=Geomonas diazotrophica TaxID=2843197 RepID=A0ABX8JIC1_9BACT|nr:type II secretion system protein GspL [Geomonas nitrogeniifigens]QWV98043.1 general secretion pathway protein GspL [Geomonas nitrogeniifigens]
MDMLIVQLKRTELVLASFRAKKGGASFLSAERHPLLGEEGELSRILCGSSLATGEHRVVLALPPSTLFMRELELPISDRAKVRELLPLELKGETALDTDQLAFDALPLSGGKVLAVWGRIQELSEKIEILKEVGLEPEVVTASLFHWDKLAPAAGTVAVSDGEAVAAYSDGAPIYFRALPPGASEADLQRTVAALELSRDLRVERVISHTPGKQEEATVSPSTKGLFEAFGDDPRAAHDLAGAYALAAAVADNSAVNLRRGPLAYTAATEKLYQRLKVSMMLAAALVLLIFAESGVRYYLVKRDLASLDRTITGIYKEVFPTRKKAVDEVAELRSEIKRLEGAKTSSNVLKLLSDVALVKGEDVFGIYETEIAGSDVRLKGDAKSIQAAGELKSRAAAILEGAEVGETKSRPDGSVTFTLSGKMKGVTR